MRVFITGGSGWIGSHTVDELLRSGHEVTAIARSDASADKLQTQGARVVRATLDDIDILRREADAAEGVLHLGNKHDWNNQAATNATEHHAVLAMCEVLAGSDRPFALASGAGGSASSLGRPELESDRSPYIGIDSPRGGTENLAFDFAERGVRSVALRYPPAVWGTGPQGGVWGGFLPLVAEAARSKGVSGYVGDGSIPWTFTHVSDAARANVLGLEKAPAGTALNIVAETISTKEVAEALGRALGIPTESVPADQAFEYFGFIGFFWAMDRSANSDFTRDLLGWTPSGPGLIETIDKIGYKAP